MVLRKVGLTGSTGMLGRHLKAALEHVGAEVASVSRSSESNRVVSACWDLTEWLAFEELDALFPEVQAVIHAGAMVQPSGEVNVPSMFDANVRACMNLGEWALERNIPVIYISGAIVYDDTLALNQKEGDPLGWSGLGGFYGFSKLLAEDVLLRLRQKGLKLAVIRATSIYGFGIADDKMVRNFLAIAEAGGEIELIQPIEDKVDLVHAADVSRAAVAIIQKDYWDVFNISSGKPISIKDLAGACIKLAGQGNTSINKEVQADYIPSVRYSLNIERAKEHLDWSPEIDIDQGLNMIIQEKLLA